MRFNAKENRHKAYSIAAIYGAHKAQSYIPQDEFSFIEAANILNLQKLSMKNYFESVSQIDEL